MTDRPSLPTWLLPVGLVVATLVAGRYVGEIDTRNSWGMVDLDVYRWGGQTAKETGSLYTAMYGGFLLFTYTPFAALVFVPGSFLSLTELRPLMSLLNVAALAIIVAACVRSLGYELRRAGTIGAILLVGALGALLEPVHETFRFGQVNLVIAAIVVVDLLLPDTSRWKGIGVGLAAGFKLTPALFIVYLGLTGRGRAAARAVGTAAATVVIGFVLLPHESSSYWFGRLFMDSSRVGGLDYLGNQSVNGVLVRTFGIGGISTPLWYLLAAITAAVGLWFASSLHRQARARQIPELAPVVVVALTGLLISPVSWSHHWVWVVPALVLFADLAVRRSPYWWGAVAGLLFVTTTLVFPPGIIWMSPAAGFQERDWTLPEALVGNLYVLIGAVTLLGSAAVWWRRITRAKGDTETPASPAPAGVSGRSVRR